jgi:hypothetical protein
MHTGDSLFWGFPPFVSLLFAFPLEQVTSDCAPQESSPSSFQDGFLTLGIIGLLIGNDPQVLTMRLNEALGNFIHG